LKFITIFEDKDWSQTTDGAWEIAVQGEKIYSVKYEYIEFVGLHLKSNLSSEDEINAVVRKWWKTD
jgi:hypothetical protein